MPVPAGPSPTLPSWAPTRDQVAAHVPRRTLVGSTTGFGQAVGAFDTTTTPTGAQVDSIILSACNWVLLVTGVLNSALEATAADTAALRAAGMVSLTWPDLPDEMEDARRLLDEATKMRADLAAANIALVGDDPATDSDDALPEFSFPASTSYDWL